MTRTDEMNAAIDKACAKAVAEMILNCQQPRSTGDMLSLLGHAVNRGVNIGLAATAGMLPSSDAFRADITAEDLQEIARASSVTVSKGLEADSVTVLQ